MENFKIEKKDKGFIEVKGEISSEDIEKNKINAAKTISSKDNFDGFREGKAPYDLVEKKYGELAIITEAVKGLILEKLPEFFAKNKIVPIDRPHIQIDSVASKAPAKFTVKLESMAAVDLPDIKVLLEDIEKPENPKDTTDTEVESIILDVKKNIFREENKEKEVPKDESALPDLTIDIIKKIYPSATSVENFKELVKTAVFQEKQTQSKYKFRKEIIDKLLSGVNYDVPKVFVDRETENGLEMFKQDAKRLNITIEDYKKDKNISEEDFMETLKAEAEKRAKTQIIFNFIAGENKIYPDEKSVEMQVTQLQKKYKNTTKQHLEAYVHTSLTNEKVFDYLEKTALGMDEDLKV